MAANLSPVGNGQIMDANGNPIVGGKIYTYTAGSSIPLASYKDNAESVAQSNPAITNTLGMLDDPLWLTSGVSYKIVIKDETDTTLQEFDNVVGVGSGSSSGSVDEWVSYSGAVTYISATQFSVVGNQTGTLHIGRRVKSQNSGGISYGSIENSVYSSPNTVVTVANSVLALDSGLSSVSYGFLSAINPSAPTVTTQYVAGDVLQMATYLDAGSIVQSTSYVQASASTFSYTPKSTSSKLLLECVLQLGLVGNGLNQLACSIDEGGSTVAESYWNPINALPGSIGDPGTKVTSLVIATVVTNSALTVRTFSIKGKNLYATDKCSAKDIVFKITEIKT